MQKGLTPLVGREEEVDLLRRRWERTVAGDGQVVLISGEAGIGKSRLLQVLKDDIVQDEHWSIEAGCSPFYQNTALYPVTDQLQRFLQFRREDTVAEKHHKLANVLRTVSLASAESLALLANLLSIPAAEGQELLNLSPQKQKEKTLEVLVTWVQREAERQPVLLAVEDLHWADPSTLELLRLLIERVSAARVLVVLTFRPEFSPPWPMRGYISTLTLSRLLHQQIEVMASRVAGEKALPKELIGQLVTKTDGVPLFVEELTKSVLESDALQERDDHYELIGPLADFHIPSTLQDSLMARLDRLNIARDIAQFGSVLGREFSYELLHTTTDIDEDRLQHGLRQLIEAELVYVQGFPPEARYTFKHALVQDAAYESLLKSTRRKQHQRVATVLIERFADTVERQPELVAYHYTQAALIEQALPYWQQAGQQAVGRSAYTEAIQHLNTGLTLLEELPDTPARHQQELQLQTTLGTALTATQGYAASEVERVYTRARELCQQLGETPQLFSVLRGLWNLYDVKAEHQTAQEIGEELLRLAKDADNPEFLREAHYALGESLFHTGELFLGRQHLEQSIALYDPQYHHSHVLRYGQDPGVFSRIAVALALWHLGYPDQALQRGQEAIDLAQALAYPFSQAVSHGLVCMVCHFRREEDKSLAHAEALITLADTHGFLYWRALGTVMRGAILAKRNDGEGELTQVHQSLDEWQATGARLVLPYYLTLLAEVYEKRGQIEEGLQMIAESLETAEKTGERRWEAEQYRRKGELLLNDERRMTNDKRQTPQGGAIAYTAEAEACFQNAVEIAQRQQAKSLELRAVTSLARLWQRQDKKAEAHQLLAEVYSWFTEGFDTQDLKEAKALLEDLG